MAPCDGEFSRIIPKKSCIILAMLYERSDNIFLCIGVRGFIEGAFLESRLLPG